jgi:hypothetical protein
MTEQVFNVPTTTVSNSVNKLPSVEGQSATVPQADSTLPQSPLPSISSINNLSNIGNIELKTKRIRILRILAVKAAAILGWNILKFEKE